MIVEITWQNGQVQRVKANSTWCKILDLTRDNFCIYLRERNEYNDITKIHNLQYARTIELIEGENE